MDVRGKKIQLFELMYYIPLGLFLAGGILLDSFYQVYGGPKDEIMICMVSILLLVIREIIFEEYGPADWTCLILTIFFFGLGVLIGSLYYASIFFMIFGGRNIPFRRIAKFALWLIIIVFVIVVVSAKLGIIRNYTSIESDRSNREYLGFLSARRLSTGFPAVMRKSAALPGSILPVSPSIPAIFALPRVAL